MQSDCIHWSFAFGHNYMKRDTIIKEQYLSAVIMFILTNNIKQYNNVHINLLVTLLKLEINKERDNRLSSSVTFAVLEYVYPLFVSFRRIYNRSSEFRAAQVSHCKNPGDALELINMPR